MTLTGADRTSARFRDAFASFERSRDETRWSDERGRRADRHEASALTALPGALTVLTDAAEIERDEQVRHAETSRLHRAYGRRLLGDERAGPALVLAIGDLVGELGLALHLTGADGRTVAAGGSLGAGAACREHEFLFGEGPATDAAATGRVVRGQMSTTDLWPNFTPVAVDAGVQSVIAVPLDPGGTCVGAVTVYSSVVGHAAVATTRLVPLLASALLALLADDLGNGNAHTLGVDRFQDVHHATGQLAAGRGCTVGDALALLRARAFADGIPLIDLSRQVLRGQTTLD